jgi:hypothetical protein
MIFGLFRELFNDSVVAEVAIAGGEIDADDWPERSGDVSPLFEIEVSSLVTLEVDKS